ncbi:hypothetical protein ABBQ38_010933 [Trebouxia sp. C0009 RCD-2024]
MQRILGRDPVLPDSALDDLPDDALQQIFQHLSTEDRRTISRTSRKWQRLIAGSWTVIEIWLGGTNYLDSASKQMTWLLSLQLEHLACLRLHLKGFELSGIGVDYLLGPLLDMLEQGALPELTTLQLAADMSLPGSLIHDGLQHLHLDMYALTATIQCPRLQTLFVRTVSMPGPTLFSTEALAVFQELKRLHLVFDASYLDAPDTSWFILEGLGLLTELQHLVLDFPKGIDIQLRKAPAFPANFTHFELRCNTLIGMDVPATMKILALKSCLMIECQQYQRWKHGPGPFVSCLDFMQPPLQIK